MDRHMQILVDRSLAYPDTHLNWQSNDEQPTFLADPNAMLTYKNTLK